MSKDIRLSLDFKSHRKRKKLQYKLGCEGVLCLIDFWLTVAEQRPSGVLAGYDESDIEIDANWTGKPGLFVSTLLDIGFLEKEEEGEYRIHNWQEKQEWVCETETRSDKARFSRLAKVNKRIFEKLKKNGIGAVTSTEYKALTKGELTVNDLLVKNNESLNESSKNVENRCKNTDLSESGEKSQECDESTNQQSPVNGASNESDKTLTDRAPKSTETLTPAPALAPAPTPYVYLTNVSGDPLLVSKNEHFREKTGECFGGIKTNCQKISSMDLFGDFNPYQWVQQQVNTSKHPGAILHTLQKLSATTCEIPNPWGFAKKIMKIENGNFNEAESVKIHEAMKLVPISDLSTLTHGMVKKL